MNAQNGPNVENGQSRIEVEGVSTEIGRTKKARADGQKELKVNGPKRLKLDGPES